MPAVGEVHWPWALAGRVQQQSSEGAMTQARAQWWLALLLGPADGEGERFRSVDEAWLMNVVVVCWLMIRSFVLGDVWESNRVAMAN